MPYVLCWVLQACHTLSQPQLVSPATIFVGHNGQIVALGHVTLRVGPTSAREESCESQASNGLLQLGNVSNPGFYNDLCILLIPHFNIFQHVQHTSTWWVKTPSRCQVLGPLSSVTRTRLKQVSPMQRWWKQDSAGMAGRVQPGGSLHIWLVVWNMFYFPIYSE